MHNSYVPRAKNSETRHLPLRDTKQPRLPPQLSAKSKKSSRTRKAHIHRLPNEILLDIFRHRHTWIVCCWWLGTRCFRITINLSTFSSPHSHLKLLEFDSFSFAQLELSRPSSPKTFKDYKYCGLRLLRRLKADSVIYQKLKNRDPDMAPSRVESSFEPNFEIESSLRVSSTRIFRVSSPVLEARLGSLRVESSFLSAWLDSNMLEVFLCSVQNRIFSGQFWQFVRYVNCTML